MSTPVSRASRRVAGVANTRWSAGGGNTSSSAAAAPALPLVATESSAFAETGAVAPFDRSSF